MLFYLFVWLPLTIILVVLAIIIFKYPEKKEELEKKIGLWFQLFFPIDWDSELDKIKKENAKALMKSTTLSQILLLRAYRKLSKTTGIYELASGRKGIGFEIDCQTYTSEKTTTEIRKAVLGLGIDDLAVQFVTYASDNVEDFVDRARESINLSGLNIDNTKELEIIGTERIEKTETWSKSSMFNSNFATFKARNMLNFITIIFPKEISDKKILSCSNEIRGKLDLAGLSPRGLNPKQVIKLYSEVLKEGSIKGIDYDPYTAMNIQLARGVSIRFRQDGGLLRIGNGTYAMVFTTEQFPKITTPLEIASAFFDIRNGVNNPLPSNFLLSTTIHIEKQEILREKILSKAKFNILRAGDEEMQKTSTEIYNTVSESKEIVQAFEEKDERPYMGMWSLVIFGDSIEELETRAGKIKSAFEKIEVGGWKLAEEQFGSVAHLVMLYSLPFQFDLQAKNALNRYNLLFSSNIQAIIPTIGAFKGFQNPIIKFFGRTGQCVGIDLWGSSTNYNCCIIGDSGTGKSFLSNTIQASNLQAGIKTFIIDKGNSYLGFCEAIGGEYITFGEDPETGEEKNICLNFFTNIIGEKIEASEFSEGKLFVGETEINVASIVDEDGCIEVIDNDSMGQIIPIVSIMAGIQNEEGIEARELSSFLESAVKIAFLRVGRNAGMKDVCQALKEQEKTFKRVKEKNFAEKLKRMTIALENYGNETGRYYKYFNGAYSIDSTKDFVVLECDDLVSKGEELYFVVIMSAILRNTQEIFSDKQGLRKRVLVVDEATPLLKNLVTAKFLDDLARRVRKHNGALMIITQKSEDFNANALGRAIWSNSAHKFCLAMDSSEIEIAYSDNGLFRGTPEAFKEIAKTIKNHKPHFSESLYFYNNNVYPLILKVGGLEYAMFSSDAKDKQKMEKLRVKYSISLADARKLFGYTIEGMTEKEAYEKILRGDQSATNQYWISHMRNALKNKTVTANIDYFYDEAQKPAIIVAEPMIKTIDGEYYRLNQFEKIADENGFTVPIFDDFLETLARISLDYVILKIPYKTMNIGVLEKIKEKMKNSQVILSLSVENCKKCRKNIEKYITKSKELGLLILVENVDPSDIDLGLLKLIKPDLLEIAKSERQKAFIDFLGDSYQFVNSNISSLKDFDEAQENGFYLFSGKYFKERENNANSY